jgi:DeoR family transcriptional regulator, aga operon transcriptional repressor
VADLLSESDSSTVVMLGGTVRRSSQSLVGDFGDVLSSRGRLSVGFFGLRALRPEHGLMELSPEETTVKRRLAAACDSIYGLFDSSKLGRFALHPFVTTDHLTGLITDEGTPGEVVEEWSARGVKVERVRVTGAAPA